MENVEAINKGEPTSMKNIIRSFEDIVNLAPILKAAFPYDVSIAAL